MPTSGGEPVQPQLAHAKNALKSALEDACDADVDKADTGDLIRLEGALAVATKAAREAVSVRRELSSGSAKTAAVADASPVHRQIKDEHGVSWDVFAVRPEQRPGRAAIPEHFREGWLAFQSETETRRLAPIPAGWDLLEPGELLRLWSAAETPPRRVG